ncbi:MAG: hypothetical protein COT74_13395 [Bdellovibrionales bacterium CG10_big_fil_rev_8_21_14_0_10_45_34]|nr:MAG: hypothetical protein COT74_13395 [Bdellovibrionales bacterium CG10_big_fil_rev_8_21_14_0_10_45_34]
MKTLDLGCGGHCLAGAVGMDHKAYPGVSIVHDINKGPWPIADNEFHKVRMQHVIEHVRELETCTKEIYRICSHGAQIEFVTPHYSSYASFGDPTHLFHFALGSIPQMFEMFVGPGKYRVIKNELKFTGSGLDFFGWIIYKISKKKYEKHFAWIFPANEIHTHIEILK